jgi:hypothetical protein
MPAELPAAITDYRQRSAGICETITENGYWLLWRVNSYGAHANCREKQKHGTSESGLEVLRDFHSLATSGSFLGTFWKLLDLAILISCAHTES